MALDSSTDSRDNETVTKKRRLVVRKSSDFREVRCDDCNRLLFKELIKSGSVEIKCPRCGHITRSVRSAISL
jgi:ribosomal protein S27E